MARKAKQPNHVEKEPNYKMAHRKVTARHIVTMEADCPVEIEHKIFKLADNLRLLGNDIVSFLQANYEKLINDNDYQNILKAYNQLSEKLKKLNKDSKEYENVLSQKKAISNEMNKIQANYQVSFETTRILSQKLAEQYNVNSIFALTRAEDVWAGMEKILYKDGKQLHYKKRLDLPVIQAKQINRGITLSTDGKKLIITVGGRKGSKGMTMTIKNPKANDLFLIEEKTAIIEFLLNPAIENDCIERYKKTGIPQDTFRPCYVQLKCERIRKKNRIFVQIVVEGKAKSKKKKDSTPRHERGVSVVAIDVGPQSVAYTSKNKVGVVNLGERNSNQIEEAKKTEKKLLRAMERSRRATNPQNYNADGTVIKSKKKWKKSKRYRKLLYKLRELRRKIAQTRKYANQEICNHLRSLGNICITEPSNIKSLQKRAKKTERQDKISTVKKKDGTIKEVRKYKRKKRWGLSIGNRAPGQITAGCKLKFDEVRNVDKMFRASQYDHTANDYIKKLLSDRMYALSDGTIVQRDCYSSFLMYCSNTQYTAPDLELCLANFESFLKLMNEFIEYITNNNIEIKNFFK